MSSEHVGVRIVRAWVRATITIRARVALKVGVAFRLNVRVNWVFCRNSGT